VATIVETITIRAPRERVFEYRLDLRNLPDYNPDVVELESLTPGPPRDGSRYRFRVRLAPSLRVRTTLTISEVDAPARIVFEMRSLLDAREVCTFETAGDTTRVRFETTVQSPRGLLGAIADRWLVAPSAQRQVRAELARMRERLEHD